MKLREALATPHETVGSHHRRDYARLRELPLLAELLDAMPTMVAILDEHRSVVFANSALVDFAGEADVDALLGRRPGEVLLCNHAGPPGRCGATEFCGHCGINRSLERAARRGRPTSGESRVWQRQRRQSYDLRVTVSPIALGERRLQLVVLEDIGDAKRRRALERTFFHDVLNTAGIVNASAELLPDLEDEAAHEVRQVIGSCSARLIEEIKAQRDLLAAEAGELTPAIAPVELEAFLGELTRSYAAHPLSAERRIILDLSERTPTIESDRTLLGRVVGNLLKNALEAARPGQKVTVSCAPLPEPDAVRVAVHNPNPMPREVQLQIFERSFSTKGAGRGLGTYSVKLLAERYLAGRVAFVSAPRRGTLFWVDLPHNARTPRA